MIGWPVKKKICDLYFPNLEMFLVSSAMKDIWVSVCVWGDIVAENDKINDLRNFITLMPELFSPRCKNWMTFSVNPRVNCFG